MLQDGQKVVLKHAGHYVSVHSTQLSRKSEVMEAPSMPDANSENANQETASSEAPIQSWLMLQIDAFKTILVSQNQESASLTS